MSSVFVGPGPARSWTLAAGVAGRREDGGGVRCSLVSSSCRFIGFLRKFASVVSGSMPMGRLLPMHASCIRPLATTTLLLAVLRWSESKAEGVFFVGSPINKLAVSPDLQVGALCLVPALQAAVVVDAERGSSTRLELSDRVRAHSGGLCGGATMPVRRRKPAVAARSLHPQTEGRPSHFLPASKPKGRQFSVRLVAMACCRGVLVAPSGFIPGDSEEYPVRLLRTQL